MGQPVGQLLHPVQVGNQDLAHMHAQRQRGGCRFDKRVAVTITANP